ncbi:DUF3592 domain-containing protein [Microbulbifer sp. EKSA008]|uniref:DUF3592 domain-containing protein n=1 Tax=Microbulbifer sp. EKSA008 TaxID=3243367 RepID=UPI0040432E8F
MSKFNRFYFSFNPYLFSIAGIFFSFAFAAFLYEVVGPVRDFLKIHSWKTMSAEILEVELAESWGDGGSVSYRTFSAYEFIVDDKAYWNNRVGINDRFESLGQYQIHIYHRLNNAKERGLLVEGWYNPKNPSEAVIDRNLRWMQVLPLIFFCLPVMIFALKVMVASVTRKRDADIDLESSDFLFKEEWRKSGILSIEHRSQWFMWLLIMLLSAPVITCIYVAIDKLTRGVYDLEIIMALFFSISLLIALYRPLKGNIQQLRYGRVPLVLVPFPGILGRTLSGYLQFPSEIDANKHNFQFSLQQVNTYESGLGENTNLQNSVNWEAGGIGHLELVDNCSRVYFAIQVAGDLPQSIIEGYIGDWWRLKVKGGMSGAWFNRTYEVPIFSEGYEVQEADVFSSEVLVKVPLGREKLDYSEDLKKLVSIERLDTGYQIRQKILTTVPTVIQFVGGLIVSAVGLVLVFTHVPFIFAAIFAIAGLLPINSALKRTVRFYQTYIGESKITCLFSWMWAKHEQKVFEKSKIVGVYMKKYTGYEGRDDRKKEYFDFYLVVDNGNKVKIISDLLGEQVANLLLKRIEDLTNLKSISELELLSLEHKRKLEA